MLNQYVVPALAQYEQGHNGLIPHVWWVQDGAPAHHSVAVRQRLQQLFPNCVVGIGHAVEWPPRSPDLTPCDFFLWGYLKDKVYVSVPASLGELERRIRAEINNLKCTRMVRHTVHAMRDRAAECINVNGLQVR